jgi:Ca2+:H+ antiporter
MNLVFNTFELVAIILSVLIVNQVVGDGESNWFEGPQINSGLCDHCGRILFA